MSAASSDSSMELEMHRVHVAGSGKDAPSGEAGIWLDGDVLACTCPDCGAPMSIRLWLMVADCFRCNASIELTEEQEQEALRLLRERERQKRSDSREAATAISPTVLRKPPPVSQRDASASSTAVPATDTPPTEPPAKEAPSQPAPARRPRRVAAAEVHRGARAHVRDIYEKGGAAVLLAGLFKDLPAWLVSLVFHLVVLLLLSLWIDGIPQDDRTITLATTVSNEDLPGDTDRIEENSVDSFEFETPGAVEMESVVQDAGAPSEEKLQVQPVEVPVDSRDLVGNLPSSVTRTRFVMPRAPTGRMFAGRDPRARAHVVKQAGGTSITEAAVARGLTFLARHQCEDGRWSLHAFREGHTCDKTCGKPAKTHNDVAATALALLPMLGAGQTHLQGEYTDEVYRALNWLLGQQKEDGDLRGDGNRTSQMYAHGQAAIALCEAYALTGDEQLRGPAQMAVNFIIRAQHKKGGWRYSPGEAGDTSVAGWQVMALKSGQMAYLHVPPRTFQGTGLYLDRAQADKVGGRYAYVPGNRVNPAMTAEGLLCRQYLGWPKDHPGLKSGIAYLLENLPDAEHANVYYWYYATQVMHHFGGEAWETWNATMRDVLTDMQQTRGHGSGSWPARGKFSDQGGPIYMTALAICTLEVYYRHLPLYGEEALTLE